jgi:hydrogenase maturation protein HypF
VVLSGGCFFNGILKRRVGEQLKRHGIRRLLVPVLLSPGDAGISLGQAVVAGEMIRTGTT